MSVYVCNRWDPANQLNVCNSFIRDYTTTVTVDRDGEDHGDAIYDGDYGNVRECDEHGDDIDCVGVDRATDYYQNTAWDAGYGFCDGCFRATDPDDNFVCDDCGDTRRPYGEEDEEGDDTMLTDPITWPRRPARRIAKTHALATLT